MLTQNFFSEGFKILPQPALTLRDFFTKYDIRYEILSFTKRLDNSKLSGSHYVVHLSSPYGETGFWATLPVGVEPTIEKFMAGLRRECRWVVATQNTMNLTGNLFDMGMSLGNEPYTLATEIRDNVSGLRWAFGVQAVTDLVLEVLL